MSFNEQIFNLLIHNWEIRIHQVDSMYDSIKLLFQGKGKAATEWINKHPEATIVKILGGEDADGSVDVYIQINE